jgi:ubiquinone/menaquinone biosynthesis C-methylase UbiE
MPLDKDETRDLYRRRARRYDRAVELYRLARFRFRRYQEAAVDALALREGDTAVEIGVGTGLNLPWIEQAVGRRGRIVGVDLTDAMLRRAEERVRRHGWSNVELVQCDAAHYVFPQNVNGVVSTLALTLVPEYDAVIRRAARALAPGGRLAIFDMKEPERWPGWLVRLAVRAARPYGVSLDLADRHPWESVRRHLREVTFREFYWGALYLSVGERDGDRPSRSGPPGGEGAASASSEARNSSSASWKRSG